MSSLLDPSDVGGLTHGKGGVCCHARLHGRLHWHVLERPNGKEPARMPDERI